MNKNRNLVPQGGAPSKAVRAAGLSVLGGLALVGVPGTAGFVSKWYLAVGAIQRGWWPVAALILASSLIAVVYVGRVIEMAWLREVSPDAAKASDPPLSMLIPVLLLAAATIYFGLDTEATVTVARKAAQSLLGGLP